ncbi:sulfatase family protein [Labilibaculum antarcticum]|uniref:Arylsulfatase n=1 Tax=Labilibaculum antarcticum TaxID=1717717 RepID=A0A1Y1CDS6_9BACT|nr:sulfatase [Labilibaculum antarcticum]BAX78470.1 arylsulfatase [Labilibaculum antarcticum]
MKKNLLILALVILSIALKAQERPNILWINGDDLGTELSCYGNPDVKTPNIDQLATEGVRFTKAYSNASVCSSSRSSMITGMYPTSINCQDHRTINRTKLPDDIHTIVEYFQSAGYFCTNASAKNWDKKGKEDYNFLDKVKYDGTDWKQRAKDQPFFAQVQISDPHRTFHHDTENPINPETVKSLPNCYPNHPLLKADWAWYLESVQHCDHYVGEILKRLEEQGLADNTIVIVFGDHGRPHLRDKQFLYEGGIKIPLIIRYPNKIKANQVDDQLVSLVDVAATSLNLAGITIPKQMHGQIFLGDKAQKRGYIYAFKQRTGDAPDNIRSISDGKYKLLWNRMPNMPWMQLSSYKKLQYPAFALYQQLATDGKLEAPYNQFMAPTRPKIELYDLEQDPMEMKNLADNKEYKSVKKKLFKILSENMKEFEKNMIPESAETINQAKISSAKYFKTGMEKKNLNEESSDLELLIYWENLLLKEKSKLLRP